MLKKLLARIAQGGTWTVESLADELNVTPALVETMLDDLTRRGYLKSVQGGCGGVCASCSMAGGCIRQAGRRLWTLNPLKFNSSQTSVVRAE